MLPHNNNANIQKFYEEVKKIANMLFSLCNYIIEEALEKNLISEMYQNAIKNESKILVINEGRIVEEGTHEALLGQSGLYKRLYDMQFQV